MVRAAAAFRTRSSGPARQSQCTKICKRLRRKTDVGEGCASAANEASAVGRVRCKTQRRGFSIITANVTSGGCGRHYLEQALPSLAVVQEHHSAHADTFTEAQTWFARLGYKSIFSPALPTSIGNGTSGGVAVVIRSHIGVTPHRGIVKMTHTERIAVVHVDACVPHGFTLIGLHLFCGEVYDDQNAGLLARVALLLASLRVPWIIVVDWQMTPAELQKTNWPRAVGGVICCCSHATCTLSNSSRIIDYFMTSLDLAHSIESVELSHVPLKPHLSVCLQLSGTSRPQLVRTCVRPRKLHQDGLSGQRVLLSLPIGLLYGCAFMRRERTRMCPRAGAVGSPWQKVRHWTFARCMASSARRLLVEVRNYVFKRKHL